jgi:hypothetical protein
MTQLAKTVVREPAAKEPEQYARRVLALAAIYLTLFAVSLAGLALIAWKGQFFVTLSQRSNVETLVLLFFIIFYAYIALITAPGARGGLLVLFFELMRALGQEGTAIERRKQRALGSAPPGSRLEVALSALISEEGRPFEPVEIRVADAAGPVGLFHIDGAWASFEPEHPRTSNNVFAYLEEHINNIVRARGRKRDMTILFWKAIDDESAEASLALTEFARNLERALGRGELWPRIELSRQDIERLEAEFSLICPALRSECFLPDLEYSAEHKLPIIPEPLGLASLTRRERRADPIATMGLTAMVVVATVGILTLFIAFPPWVPGS